MLGSTFIFPMKGNIRDEFQNITFYCTKTLHLSGQLYPMEWFVVRSAQLDERSPNRWLIPTLHFMLCCDWEYFSNIQYELGFCVTQTNGKWKGGNFYHFFNIETEFQCVFFISENYWLLSLPAGAGDVFNVPPEGLEKGVFQKPKLLKCISEISKLLRLLIHHWLHGLFCSDLGP